MKWQLGNRIRSPCHTLDGAKEFGVFKMSVEVQAWDQIMKTTKNTSKEVLEKLRCPSCHGKLRFLWTPSDGGHGDLAVECMSCFNGFNKTTDDIPLWGNQNEQTVFHSVPTE